MANERRRNARAHHDGRYQPGRDRLILMAWNIFLTKVSRQGWPPQCLGPLSRLRWRIEMIFKSWQSHWGLRQFNARSASLLRLSVMTQLLFCVLVYCFRNALELIGDGQNHVRLWRWARILGQGAGLLAAAVLHMSPAQWWEHPLTHPLFYEKRKDRKNYFELVAELNNGLA